MASISNAGIVPRIMPLNATITGYLLKFVQTLEEESRFQARQIDDVRMNRSRPNGHLDVTIPPVRPDYAIYKANAAKTSRKKSKKN